jgi:choloylglycine hydrolase
LCILRPDPKEYVTLKVIRHFVALLAVIALSATGAPACTTFVIRDGSELVLGKNLDWISGDGLVIVNKRGLAKKGLSDPGQRPAQWVSKYGSVTFNQVGKELPYGGMNEAGLVVEQMMLEETVYPEPDERVSISECQWIQFQLDNFATVEEVIESDSLVRISPASTPLHFLILDASGNAATIEFLDGEMVYHTGEDLPVKALANSTYSESVRCLRDSTGASGNLSLQHFLDAAAMIEGFGKGEVRDIIEYSFEVLERVSQGQFTRWSIVYDVANTRIYFKTSASPGVKVVDSGDFEYSCALLSMAVGIDLDKEGLVNGDFVDYTAAMNREVIFATFKIFREHDFLDVSDSDLEALSDYPDAFECVEY